MSVRSTLSAALAIATALIVAVGCSSPSGPPAPTSSTAPGNPGWQLTFDDEFDGPAGSAPDPDRWQPDKGGTGWGNQELQYYTPDGNTFLDGRGHLVIEARAESGAGPTCWYGSCRYSSGKLTTTGSGERVLFSQQYGRFEARMKLPQGSGLLSAFWLLGDNLPQVGYPRAGEIDVVEMLGNQTSDVEQHVHAPGIDYGTGTTLPTGQIGSDWHTYAVVWTPTEIDWQVDGNTTRTLTKQQAGARWDFDHPFYLLLNLAVGGNWPGSPGSDTQFPARMLVDYVRVYSEAT
ncbi:glycoside hydrolase family 16 protein [Nocardia heshunensis]